MNITRHDSIQSLKNRMRLKENAEISDRIHAVVLALKGLPGSQIAAKLDYGTAWVSKWVYRYRDRGFEGLIDRPRSGQPKKLTLKQEEQFAKMIEKGPKPQDLLSRFRIEDLKKLLEEKFGVEYSISGVKKLVHRLGFSSIKPRPRHPQNDPKKMRAWKRKAPRFVEEVKKKES